MYNKCIYILESISSLTPQFVTHFWSALKGVYSVFFSLEFECKREIMADQKAMGSARVHPVKMDAYMLFLSLLNNIRKIEVGGASIRHSYIDSSLISGLHIGWV